MFKRKRRIIEINYRWRRQHIFSLNSRSLRSQLDLQVESKHFFFKISMNGGGFIETWERDFSTFYFLPLLMTLQDENGGKVFPLFHFLLEKDFKTSLLLFAQGARKRKLRCERREKTFEVKFNRKWKFIIFNERSFSVFFFLHI